MKIMITSLDTLECVDKFCYLGNLIGAGGGVEETSRARVGLRWSWQRSWAIVLTSRGAFVKVKEKPLAVSR